jgi:hypothetical protein
MSNLAYRIWDAQSTLSKFVEEIYTPRIKPSVLKFQRDKHPTGFAEQQQREARVHRSHWSDYRRLRTQEAKAPFIEEGLAEVIGTISSKPAYAGCAEDYLLMLEAEEQTANWQQMDRYSMFLFNKGIIGESDMEWGYIPLGYYPEHDEDLPSEWLEFLEIDAPDLAFKFRDPDLEDEGIHWSDVLGDEQTHGKGYDPEIEFGIINEMSFHEEENPYETRFFASDIDGEEVIYDDDQRFYMRQECGSLFEDEECHIPPSQEKRFDTLGSVSLRNLQGFGV